MTQSVNAAGLLVDPLLSRKVGACAKMGIMQYLCASVLGGTPKNCYLWGRKTKEVKNDV